VEKNTQNITLYVKNMTCRNCERKIEQELIQLSGVKEVNADYNKSICKVVYEERIIRKGQIIRRMEEIDYPCSLEPPRQKIYDNENIKNMAGAAFVLIALYFILKGLGVDSIFYKFPQAKATMGYGMLFVIGFFTSFHCMAMCGGLHLSQSLKSAKSMAQMKKKAGAKSNVFYAPVLYNAGRLLSYTVIGAMIGGLGSIFHLSIRLNGIVQIVAGIFMIIMGLNLLNIFPILHIISIRFPKVLTKRLYQGQTTSAGHPFVIGLLNGLMPCGPLQAMQLYALSTGSPVKGGISMFLFCLGTIPVMLGMGAISSFLSSVYKKRIAYMGAFLVLALGVFMLKSGLLLSEGTTQITNLSATTVKNNSTDNGKSGTISDATEKETQTEQEIQTSTQTKNATQTAGSKQTNTDASIQKVQTTFDTYTYKPVTVKANIPVQWTIHVKKGFLTGCNYRMMIPEYNLQKELKEGDNVIEFTPTQAGTYDYSCWMGMVSSTITVEK